mgnify:FL=1
MDDERIWDLERSLWTGDGEHYRELIDEEALFVVPAPPFIMTGNAAADSMADTPRWSSVTFSDEQVSRPQEGLIIIAYHAQASSDDDRDDYAAHCTTTLRRLSHEEWRVVQHQQTPPLVGAQSEERAA